LNSAEIRLIKLEDSLQLCSAPEYYDSIRRALLRQESREVSAAAREVLAIVAYYQPVTRTYIEQIRGVDSSYTVGLLAERGFIRAVRELDVPGEGQCCYRTTHAFLRVLQHFVFK
jgi:segregation and condensation protein B